MIGYACISMTLDYRTNRRFILKNFTEERFYKVVKENLCDLRLILKENLKNHIYFFRISSDIIPFGSHKINKIKWWEVFEKELNSIGKFIKENNIRVSMHPGQYTILNSSSQEVVDKSIKEIEYHNMFLNSLGLNYTHKIVLHIGGAYGDKLSALDRFKNNFKELSFSARNRLIIENDDKIYNIEEVLGVCRDINVPAVFDNLHNKCNPSLNNDIDKILKEVISTWKESDGRPKIHYSDSDKLKKMGAHSQFIDTKNFLEYYNKVKKYDLDIMLEVKDKDISAIKCVNLLENCKIQSISKKRDIIFREWAKYKYVVMEKGYDLYKKCSDMVNTDVDIIQFYQFIDNCLNMTFDQGNFKNTAQHIWGYFKDKANEREKNQVINLIENEKDYKKIKEKIRKLAIKYNVKYLLDSYYFYY